MPYFSALFASVFFIHTVFIFLSLSFVCFECFSKIRYLFPGKSLVPEPTNQTQAAEAGGGGRVGGGLRTGVGGRGEGDEEEGIESGGMLTKTTTGKNLPGIS